MDGDRLLLPYEAQGTFGYFLFSYCCVVVDKMCGGSGLTFRAHRVANVKQYEVPGLLDL